MEVEASFARHEVTEGAPSPFGSGHREGAMEIAANYGSHARKRLRVVFTPPVGVETDRSKTERTESRLSVLRHPLIVGAVLAVLSGLFASLVIPAVTRVWHDRPNELALKEAVVERISQRATTTIATGRSFASIPVESVGFNDRVASLDNAERTWQVDSAGVVSQLNTYFRHSAAATQWPAFAGAVSQFLEYSAETTSGRPVQQSRQTTFERVQQLEQVDKTNGDQLNQIAKLFRSTSFRDPAAEKLRQGFVSSPTIFPHAVAELLDDWKLELSSLVLDSKASGFSHGYWFFH
jgi:hypothetical protein